MNYLLLAALAASLLLWPMIAEARTIVVNNQHPSAADDAAGTADAPLKTINAAAQLAQPGDTVLVHPGVYRERVSPARGGEAGKPIIYQAVNEAWSTSQPAKQTIVKGSEAITPKFTPVAGAADTYRMPVDVALFGKAPNAFAVAVRASRGGMTQGQICLDGVPMTQVADEKALAAAAGTWLAADKGTALLVHMAAGADPAKGLWELSVRKRAFAPLARCLGYITVRGFVFEHACNDVCVPQMGMVSARSGHHWVFEHNIVRHARSIGLDCGNEWGIEKNPDENDGKEKVSGTGWHLIRENIFCDNGQCGLTGLRPERSVVVGNIVERNARTVPGFESAGIKFHFFFDGLIEGNLIRDNDNWGIWLDHSWESARITRNVVYNNRFAGVFMELGEDPQNHGLIDNNLIIANRGHGVYSHDASDVWVAHNLIYGNADFGIFMQVATERGFNKRGTDGISRGMSGCQRQHLANNLILANGKGAISLPSPGGRATKNFSDSNGVAGPAGQEVCFQANLKNGTKMDGAAVLSAAQQAFEKTGDPGLPPEELETFKSKGPTVTLKQWQSLMKFDGSSAVVALGNYAYDPKTFQLRLSLDGLAAVKTTPIAEMDKDFTGQLMPRQAPLPGPFQKLSQPGGGEWTVWPIKFDVPADLASRPVAARPTSQPQK
jgi:parallel beta-helix repeat protein